MQRESGVIQLGSLKGSTRYVLAICRRRKVVGRDNALWIKLAFSSLMSKYAWVSRKPSTTRHPDMSV